MAMTFRASFAAVAALATLGGLGACSTVSGGDDAAPALRGTNVTRIHLGSEIARGEVAVEPRFAVQAAGGVYEPAFATSVADELRTLGFLPAATPGASEFVATVDVATGTMTALRARAPAQAAAAPGGATMADTVATQLAVQLKRRSDGSIVWEGHAQSAARAGTVPGAAVVGRLARALFRDFPGESGRTTNVR